ncbi:MAG: TonB-dependent receptor [Acidobacteria bacterium]|nr:MAG: TonB-dependent receptor [Acidobacteriota bacterium]
MAGGQHQRPGHLCATPVPWGARADWSGSQSGLGAKFGRSGVGVLPHTRDRSVESPRDQRQCRPQCETLPPRALVIVHGHRSQRAHGHCTGTILGSISLDQVSDRCRVHGESRAQSREKPGDRYRSGDPGGGFLIEADAFYRRIDDYITIEPDPSLPKRLPLSPPIVFRYINGTGAQFYGGEVRVRRALGPLIGWRGSLSSVWAEDESLNEPVIGIPPLRGQLGVNVHSPDGRFWVDLNAIMVDAQTRVAISRFERPTPGYAVFDLRTGAHLSQHWTLHVGLENIGNRFIVDHLNAVNPFTRERIPEPGRNVYVGLEISF